MKKTRGYVCKNNKGTIEMRRSKSIKQDNSVTGACVNFPGISQAAPGISRPMLEFSLVEQ